MSEKLCFDNGLSCVDNYCCKQPYYHCCDYDRFAEEQDDGIDPSHETFVHTGLKSALVLLIMSSAIFLVCFCVMRCCRRAITRVPRHDHEVTVADYRRAQLLGTSHLDAHCAALLNDNHARSHAPSPAVEDEPPSYNEVVGGTEFIVIGTGDNQRETDSIDSEKPPPEYSSIVKQTDIP